MIEEFNNNLRLIACAIAKMLRFVAVATAGKIDKNGPTRTELRIANDAGIFIGRGAAEAVNKQHGVAGTGEVLPADGAASLLRVKTVHKHSFDDALCIYTVTRSRMLFCL
ncbi:hypothetical protein D3C76_1105850 [compost metagenome]